jgi:hypothetical protein
MLALIALMLLALVALNGCANIQSAMQQAQPVVGAAISESVQPVITSVSTILPEQTQQITIVGCGFGNLQPYTGDSSYIQISDLTKGWNAGTNRWAGLGGGDWTTLHITSWTNTQIIISGFSGDYGTFGWTLSQGDHIEIDIWNAQTGGQENGSTLPLISPRQLGSGNQTSVPCAVWQGTVGPPENEFFAPATAQVVPSGSKLSAMLIVLSMSKSATSNYTTILITQSGLGQFAQEIESQLASNGISASTVTFAVANMGALPNFAPSDAMKVMDDLAALHDGANIAAGLAVGGASGAAVAGGTAGLSSIISVGEITSAELGATNSNLDQAYKNSENLQGTYGTVGQNPAICDLAPGDALLIEVSGISLPPNPPADIQITPTLAGGVNIGGSLVGEVASAPSAADLSVQNLGRIPINIKTTVPTP